MRQGRKICKPPIKYMQIIVNLEFEGTDKKIWGTKKKRRSFKN